MNHVDWVDRLVVAFDQGLRSVLPPARRVTMRASPGLHEKKASLTKQETRHAIGLMRVNHSGEVCAQALYQGQALTAKQSATTASLKQAALEENDHLGWCEDRLNELGGRLSMLNPIWYMASLMLGAGAGLLGDKISLGFVVEIERQVEAHLDKHLALLPQADKASRAVLLQMQQDEAHHADQAVALGGIPFPSLIKHMMRWGATVMTKSSYYL